MGESRKVHHAHSRTQALIRDRYILPFWLKLIMMERKQEPSPSAGQGVLASLLF